jgi:hypothetical protein
MKLVSHDRKDRGASIPARKVDSAASAEAQKRMGEDSGNDIKHNVKYLGDA